MIALLRALIADAEADLEAERAKLRRWQLRLRWRAERNGKPLSHRLDRLTYRAWRYPFGGALLGCASGDSYYLPIAGPRGVLP